MSTSDAPNLEALTDDLLTPDVRVYQRKKGHRFSSDDVATAFVAFGAHPAPMNALDLGSGLGSVLLLLAWKMRATVFTAVEAQTASFALLERNVARSGFADRISIAHGDFRSAGEALRARGPFDLVTGTPPYFPPGASVAADDAQREYARIEHRGGVEAYVEAGELVLAPTGTLVLCGDARAEGRVQSAARAARLAMVEAVEVIPKEGKATLFTVWVLRRTAPDRPSRRSMTLRSRTGESMPDADALRVFSGFPSRLAPTD